MSMKHVIAILLITTALSTAADNDENKKLLKEMEGSYDVTSIQHLGEELPITMRGEVTIEGDRFSARFQGGGKVSYIRYTISVDATKKPAQIDLKADNGKDKGKTSVGIIRIEGDTINLCFDRPSDHQKRPTEFKTSKNVDFVETLLYTLKKKKE
jgi:uncharacterized protein (TIGR03067 family)